MYTGPVGHLTLIFAQRLPFFVPKICYWYACRHVVLSCIQWRASNH